MFNMENTAKPIENETVGVKKPKLNAATQSTDVLLKHQIIQIFDDIRILAYAELSYYKARISYARNVAKWTGLFASLAMFALFGAVVALILGSLLVLAQVIGPLFATIGITIGFLVVGFLFAFLAYYNSRKFYFPEVAQDDDK
jgi:hypothetical protein